MPQGIVHAIRYLRATGHRAPTVLGYTPAYRNNPYQELLYRGLWESGIAPVALPSAHDVDHLAVAQSLGAQVILHIHWTNQLSDSNREVTRENHFAFRRKVEDLITRGAKVVWTLHNRLPHECDHPDEERSLREWLVEVAEVVHVMGPNSRDAVADLYPLCEAQTVEVPHPSYRDVYPETVSRTQARWELGLSPDEDALLLFGGIRPYKNVQLALDVLDELLAEGRRVRLIVAGKMMGEWPLKEELEFRIVAHPATAAHLHRIEESDVQRYFLASDLLLLPYTAIMNSGVLLLGATYGLPVVGPADGEVGNLIRNFHLGAAFQPRDNRKVVAGLVGELLDGDLEGSGRRSRELALSLDPDTVAETFRNRIIDPLLLTDTRFVDNGQEHSL